MLHAMRDVDGTGRLYEIDYTADYRLDDVLKAGYTQTDQLFSYIATCSMTVFLKVRQRSLLAQAVAPSLHLSVKAATS